jgi:hypothetical protein
MPGYTPQQKAGLSLYGPKKNYWVIGKDGKRRGPAPLTRDGVRIMEQRGATCVELKQGEFWTTEVRNEV